MKKLALFLAVATTVAFSACTSKENKTASTDETTPAEVEVVAETVEATDSVVVTDVVEATEEAADAVVEETVVEEVVAE